MVTPTSSRSSSASSSAPRTPPNLHQNSIDPSAKWLVQKFGGTSVGKFPVKIAQEIVANYVDDNKVAVVCSARSGSTKALGTTSLLLRAASEALRRGPASPKRNGSIDTPGIMTPVTKSVFGSSTTPPQSGSPPSSPRSRNGSNARDGSPSTSFGGFTPMTPPPPDFHATADLIRQEHLKAARESVQDLDIRRQLEDEIERDCDWLLHYLSAAQIIDEVSPRSRDTIVGLGERLACKIMTAVLRDQGIDAEYVSLDDVVPQEDDSDSANPGSLDQSFYDRLSVALGERIQQCGSRVPVVTGFFGPVPGSLLHQVGRGYTDLLSALLAVGLEASELQIWKEVDGIFTADPRKVPTARLLSIISPDEAAELTYYGSEVVHPFTMEQVIRRKIPIRIKNVDNPRGGGTVIFPDPDADAIQETETGGTVPEPASLSMLENLSLMAEAHHHRKMPTAVTIKEKIVVLNVNSNRKSVSHGFLAGIFGTLDRFGVVVDLISTSEVHVSMAIEDSLAPKLLDRLVTELRKSGTVSAHRDMAILSLVGKQMRNMVGIAGRMFTTLAQGNVNIEMISQGASEINISCVIEARDAVKALNLIHQSCLNIKPEPSTGPWLF
ncbi:aspartate kinase [Schizophyllum commune H4-8]|uniref:aspartate kinase n=1 Tax=Schizophyllum commune (strain H4-8 / FGSC 9210) TaxID=578458 RepID=UPI00215FDDD9|nr:aspartate kinase [Schizophyllum commune H4-8]KAI5888665.1 aspartate kinase [Schizophyllum commune H4-8]